MVTLKQRLASDVTIGAGSNADIGTAMSLTGTGAERLTGAILEDGTGTLRVDLEWQDEDGTTLVTEQGVGNPFDKPIVAPKVQVRGVETGSSNSITAKAQSTFMVTS